MAHFVWTNPLSVVGVVLEFFLKRLLFLPKTGLKIALPSETDAWKGKRVLVVGGTKGIGRGIATTLAESNCSSVHIVGRDQTAAADVISVMQKSIPNGNFRFHQADLLTVKGCCKLVDSLDKTPFDVLVFTVGAFPATGNISEQSPDGLDKVIQLDLVARYTITKKLLDSGVLKSKGIVLSVLGAGLARFDSLEKMKGRIDGSVVGGYFILPTMATAVSSHDVMLHNVADSYPNATFVATYPGVIKTGLLDFTIGKSLAAVMHTFCEWSTLAISERQAGLNHLAIARHFFTREQGRNLYFFDDDLTEFDYSGAVPSSEFRNWLSEFLSACLKKGE